MSPTKYFFEPTADARDLPKEGKRRSPHIAATSALIYGDGDVHEAADRLMEELTSPHTLARDCVMSRPFSSVFGLLFEFSRRYPTVTVSPAEGRMPSVSVSLHALYFAAGTAVHHTAKEGTPITLRAVADKTAPSVLITADKAARNEEEALSVLGLDGGRLTLLRALGERGGFTMAVTPGECCELRITVKTATLGTLTVQANSDPSLLSAFFLPISYFCM